MNGFSVSTDKSKLDVPTIVDFLLHRSYWGGARSEAIIHKSIDNSYCFALLDEAGKQCGFARVVSDLAVYAYLMDVFMLEGYRGQGVGKWFLAQVFNDSLFVDVMRWELDTDDAHGLYAQFGFEAPRFPERKMQKRS